MSTKRIKVYLDICCFNRPFDDQLQLRIRLESEAKLGIQEKIRSGAIGLVWSYVLDYENGQNPYQERNLQIADFKKYSMEDVEENPKLTEYAEHLVEKGLHQMDSLHIACAIHAESDYFLTTDDRILKKSGLFDTISIIDPIGFIKLEVYL